MISWRTNTATIVGIALVLMGIGAIAASFTISAESGDGWGPRIFPLVGSISLFVLGALELLKGIREPNAASSDRPKSLNGILVLLLLSLLYVWLMAKFGYLISTGIVAPMGMYLFGVRNPVGLIVAAILCPAIYHFIFFVGLGVFPPLGEWFDLLDFIREI